MPATHMYLCIYFFDVYLSHGMHCKTKQLRSVSSYCYMSFNRERLQSIIVSTVFINIQTVPYLQSEPKEAILCIYLNTYKLSGVSILLPLRDSKVFSNTYKRAKLSVELTEISNQKRVNDCVQIYKLCLIYNLKRRKQ